MCNYCMITLQLSCVLAASLLLLDFYFVFFSFLVFFVCAVILLTNKVEYIIYVVYTCMLVQRFVYV